MMNQTAHEWLAKVCTQASEDAEAQELTEAEHGMHQQMLISQGLVQEVVEIKALLKELHGILKDDNVNT